MVTRSLYRCAALVHAMAARALLLQLLSCSLLAARAEVQGDFSPDCRQFLFMGTPPRGLEDQSLKKICQRFNGRPRYVTLYDVMDHIPVYSAYTFKRSDGSKKVDAPWMYEPQVGPRIRSSLRWSRMTARSSPEDRLRRFSTLFRNSAVHLKLLMRPFLWS